MYKFIQEHETIYTFLSIASIVIALAIAAVTTTRVVTRLYPEIPFSAITPAVITTCFITGLLLGFVFQRAWESFDTASRSLNKEVLHLGQIASAGSFLSGEHSAKILEGVKIHIHHVLETEWLEMTTEHGPTLTQAPGLSAIKAALMFTPRDESERLGQQFILSALSEAAAARSSRIGASHASIAPALWATIICLSILLLVGIAFATSATLTTASLAVTLYSLSLALVMTIIIDLDHPFSGGITISKKSMQDLLVFLSPAN